MSVLAALHFGGGARTPQILQTEAAECGLACIAMIAGFHGHAVDLATLRSRHPISAKGAGLAQLMEVAVQLQLAARPVRLEFAALARLGADGVQHADPLAARQQSLSSLVASAHGLFREAPPR